MTGPMPKNPTTRQRRNKSVSRAVLPSESSPIRRAPSLPDLRQWQPLTLKWWHDIWVSPMSGEYLRADMHALFRLAVLVDMFWSDPSRDLAAEIRQQQQAFGLTPLDRRRLEWQVIQTEEAANRHEDNRSRRAKIIDDPRGILE